MTTLQMNSGSGSYYIIVPKKLVDQAKWEKGTYFKATLEPDGIKFRELK
jgi:hypothetical protein